MKIRQAKKEFICKDYKPFKSAHASTLLAMKNGDILASWFGGTWEGNVDVVIWLARKRDGKWSKARVVADHEGVAQYNPVLFQNPEGRIYIYYKVGHTIPNWQTYYVFSDDGGERFSPPQELVVGDIGGRGPVKNKAIIRTDGAVLAPASIEGDLWDSFIDISYDGGQSWEKSERIPVEHVLDLTFYDPASKYQCVGKGIIQPTIWESSENHIHALMRSTGGCVFRSESLDGGHTWAPAYKTNLVHNNSGIDLVQLADGGVLLVHNPIPNDEGRDTGPRTPLVLSYSKDNGENWTEFYLLEDEEGEYSYPAIVTEKTHVYITYTWNREHIVFWELELEPN